MILEASIFHSKVAQRIFLLFILSALIPIAVSSLLSFRHATKLFAEQNIEQLRQASKNYSMSLIERLQFLDATLKESITHIHKESTFDNSQAMTALDKMARTITLIQTDDNRWPIKGHIVKPPKLNSEIFQNVAFEKSILFSHPSPSGNTRALMALALNQKNLSDGILLVEINPSYLWGNPESFPLMTDFCVFDHVHRVQFCSYPSPNDFQRQYKQASTNSKKPVFQWTADNKEYLAYHRELFLDAEFSSPSWLTITIKPQNQQKSAISSFTSIFIPTTLLSILLVALLSMNQVQRTLHPLEILTKGAQRIADRNFKEKVILSSGDEFESLATALNTMMAGLDKQFSMLSILSMIDRSILATSDIRLIQSMVLNYINEIFPCNIACIALFDNKTHTMGDNHILIYDSNELIKEKTNFTEKETQLLIDRPSGFQIDLDINQNSTLTTLKQYGAKTTYIIPIIVDNSLGGIINIGYWEMTNIHTDDAKLAHDLADRLAVTLSTISRNEKLHIKSYYDELTGLPNRQSLREHLTQTLIMAHKHDSMTLLISINLDGFRRINEAYGHTTGDTLLKQAASRLKQNLEENGFVARLGADEFVIIIPHAPEATAAVYLAENLIKSIAEPFMVQNEANYLSASIGIAVCPNDSKTGPKLLKQAHTAMQRAKESGRGKYAFYTEKMDEGITQRITLERELRRALKDNEFELYFQPKVDIHTNRISGVEALIRWHHPTKGLLLPDAFIPCAEETGLIDTIDKWVLKAACTQFKTWQTENIKLQSIAVNISAQQFIKKNFAEFVIMTLDETGMPANHLELEITESLIMNDIEMANKTLHTLHAHNVQIAIDDFGTGYSSLAYLNQLPFQTLKIDRSFITDIPHDKDTTAIAKSIIMLAQTLDKNIVAEGVETKEQLGFLLANNCQWGQGFYYSPALPAHQLAKFYHSKNTDAVA